MKSLAGQR